MCLVKSQWYRHSLGACLAWGKDHIRKKQHFSIEPAPAPEAPTRGQSVEDFVPEDGLDRSFLEDTTVPKDKVGAKGPQHTSDR